MDLASLRFVVDTKALEEAGKKIDELGNKVQSLSTKTSGTLTKAAEKAAKSTKEMGNSADNAAQKVTKLSKTTEQTLNPVEALQTKLKNTFGDLATGFTRGESSILNIARAMNASEAEMNAIKAILKDISTLIKDPFDSAIGSVRSISREFDILSQRSSLANQGIVLTTKQLREYSRIADEVAGKIKAQGLDPTKGKGLAAYNTLLKEQQSDYLMIAQATNQANDAEKKRLALLRQEEELMKLNATAGDAMVAQFRKIQEANIKESETIRRKTEAQQKFNQEFLRLQGMGFSASESKKGAGMLLRGGAEADVLSYMNSAKAQREATIVANQKAAADKKASAIANERAAAERTMGDAMVAQYRRRQGAIDAEIRKLKEQRDALKASQAVMTGNLTFRLGNLGANSKQIAEAKELRREIEALGKAARQSQNPMKGMASILRQIIPSLGALSAGAVVAQLGNEFVKTADYITLFRSRLDYLSKGTLDFNKSFEQLVRISNESRTSVQDTSVFFSRLVPIMGSVGRSTEDAFTVTEAFSKLLLVSGTNGREASAAMYQLSQALGKGKLDGDEFRTVAEAVPELLRIMEKQLGVTRAELYKMSEQGQLTADVVMNALTGSLNDLNTAAEKMPKTVEGATKVLGNAATNFTKAMDEALKLTDGLAGLILQFAKLIDFLSENKEVVVTFLGLLSGAATLLGIAKLSQGLLAVATSAGTITSSLSGIAAVIAANPILAGMFIVGGGIITMATYNSPAAKNLDEVIDRLRKLRSELDAIQNDPYAVAGSNGRESEIIKQIKELEQQKAVMSSAGDYSNESKRGKTLQDEAKARDEHNKKLAEFRNQLNGATKDYPKFLAKVQEATDFFNRGDISVEEYNKRIKQLYAEFYKKPKDAKTELEKEAEKIDKFISDMLDRGQGLAENFTEQLNLWIKAQSSGKYSTEELGKALDALWKKQPQVAEGYRKQYEESEKARKAAEELGKQLDTMVEADYEIEIKVKTIREAYEEQKSNLEFDRSIFGMTDTEQKIATQQREIQKKLAQDILDIKKSGGSDEIIKKQTEELEIIAEQNKQLAVKKALMEKNQQTAIKMADIFGNAFSDLILEGKSFGDVLQNLTKQVINLVFEILVLEPLKASLRGVFGGPSIFSFLGFANGGAFSDGVQKFANGGAFTNQIVSAPTLFPMRNGTGMMGEAGPEAIMPLTRTSGGQLGVRMEGSAGPTVVMENNITIQVQGGNTNEETAAVVSQEMIKTMQGIARNEIVQAKRTGGVLR